jgi:hypothetical protein
MQKNHHLLILDTEGIGSVDINKNHDSNIILLALMISSYFIYNSVGTLDEISLQDIG